MWYDPGTKSGPPRTMGRPKRMATFTVYHRSEVSQQPPEQQRALQLWLREELDIHRFQKQSKLVRLLSYTIKKKLNLKWTITPKSETEPVNLSGEESKRSLPNLGLDKDVSDSHSMTDGKKISINLTSSKFKSFPL